MVAANLCAALEIIPFSVRTKMEMHGRIQKKSKEPQPVPVMNGVKTLKGSFYYRLKNKCHPSFGKNWLAYIGGLCFFLASACSEPNPGQGSTEKKFDRPGIPTVSSLRGEKHVFEDIIMPGSLLFKQNKLVISDKSENGYLTHIIDTDSWKYLNPMGVIGYGPGETPSVWTMESGLDPDYFWTYGLSAKTLSQYPLKETPEKLSVRQIKQNEDFFLAMGLTWSSDSTLMTYLVRGEDKFVEFTIDGTRLNGYGKWENTIPGNYSSEIIASLHQGKLMGNPKTNKFLKACILRDRLELFDKKSGVIISIDGPLNHIPQFKVVGTPGNQSPIVQSDQPLAYMDAFLGDELVFGLYSGKTDQEIMEIGRGETEIFVFDQKGEVLALFNLDTPISAFTVDEANKRIFGIT